MSKYSRLYVAFVSAIIVGMLSVAFPQLPVSAAIGAGPVLHLTHRVSQEPLLGGQITYALTISNGGATPVADRGYNLTISDTLPSTLTYLAADPAPTAVQVQADGSTQLFWDNIVDLEVNEDFRLSITAALKSSVTPGTQFTNVASAKVNTAPDNSGLWVQIDGELTAQPQAVDIELSALPSTATEQATGAGEYPATPGRTPGADWPYQYRVTVRNNNVGLSESVVAKVTLPAGVAYLGNVAFSSNPNNVNVAPTIQPNDDGSLALIWALGNLTTTQYATPIAITFSTAIPYRFRTNADAAAKAGPYAGPMSGEVIPEDTILAVGYEATAQYAASPTADGSESTPYDDEPARVTAEILTVAKSASPGTVGVGTQVAFSLNYYVSEYYTVTNGVLVDVLPDGMSYVDDSANLAPRTVEPNLPGPGQTTITWDLPATATTPGTAAAVTFKAVVDSSYEAAPLAGQPIVSGDRLTNQVTVSGEWQDTVDNSRLGSTTPDSARATVSTRMPGFDKVVQDPANGQWVRTVNAFAGDTLTFKLMYQSAADIDAKAIVIRDFLPRGMSYVDGSAVHAVNGTFADGPGCTATPQTPSFGTLNGLQYLEWRLCNAARGATWQATIQAKVGPVPDIQPGWIVANFGKLSGQNSYGTGYSLRAMATTNYRAPKLVLEKGVSPSSNLKGGSVITYTIKVTNQGDATAHNLVVQDTLPVSLTVASSGGTGTPNAASYTTISGNPAAALGGVLQWSNVASLAPGASQTYRYSAVIPQGLPAGASLTNLASVRYNSRADNQGHLIDFTADVADDNTDDAVAYIKGFTIAKRALQDAATIGDTVTWVLTVTVPAGVKGFWPIVEENDLPAGFDYVPNSTVVTGATLDTVAGRHPTNPKDDGDRDLRWFLDSVDNSASATDYLFTIRFDTLVTGVKGNQKTTTYYPNNGALENAVNTARVGWYDTAAGYNNTGYAWDGFETNRINRRSAAATFTVKIRQPRLTLQKVVSHGLVGAGEIVTYTLSIRNVGHGTAHDIPISDLMPAGLTLVGTPAAQVVYANGFPTPAEPDQTHVTPAAAVTGTHAYDIDRIYAGATVNIVYRAQVAPTISADLVLTNTASIASYSSQPGVKGDTNGDTLADERSYAGLKATAVVRTPEGSIRKNVRAGELTYGGTLLYRIVVPAEKTGATMYNVVVTDTIDSNFTIVDVKNGAAQGNLVSAAFASIPANTQQVVEVTVLLPENSPLVVGTLLRNQAWVRYDSGGVKASSEVSNRVVAPALMVEKEIAQLDVNPGDLAEFSIRVRNVGNGHAEKLQLADLLPEIMHIEPGSVVLNGAAFDDPQDTVWALPSLPGKGEHLLTFKARVDKAMPGYFYTNTAKAIGVDSRGQPIPADNSIRVPADLDPDDTATASFYGPLTWSKESTYVAFEDLKNVGWSDWDYNDFIVQITFERGLTPEGNLAALRLHYTPKARGGAFDHQFLHQLPVYGGGSYKLALYDSRGSLVNRSAGQFRDEPALEIFAHTRSAMPLPSGQSYNLTKFPFTNTMQEQTGTVVGYTASMEVLLWDATANLSKALPPLPWDPYLFVYQTGQEVHLVQPGRLDNTQVVNNAFDRGNPMLGFDLPLANVYTDNWFWPQEFLGIWRVYPDYVAFATTSGAKAQDWSDPGNKTAQLQYAWHSSGGQIVAANADWGDSVSTRYFATPVIADVDGDGRAEIIVGNLVRWHLEVYNADGTMRAGWPQVLQAEVKAAANVADLDGDGKLDILVGDTRGYLHAFHHDGTKLAGWPIKAGLDPETPVRILSKPAVADVDGDGAPEVILALADGKLYVYAANGALEAGWPVSIGDAADLYGSHTIDSSPTVADIDGDGLPEILVGAYDKHVYAYRGNGTLAWRFATRDVVMSTPAVGDIDPARPGLETVFGSGDRFVYVVDKDGQLLWRRPTGWTVRSSPLVADIDRDGDPEIVIGGDDHNVWAWHHDGSAVAGWPQSTGSAVFSSPVLADVDGDGVAEIVVGSDDMNIYAFKADGSLAAGWPQATGAPVKGAPAVGNLDGDPEMEVVVADFDGVMKYYGQVPPLVTGTPLYLPIISRR